jgi:hypothetical protein
VARPAVRTVRTVRTFATFAAFALAAFATFALAAFATFAAFAGCDGSWGGRACAPGNARPGDGACTVPAATIVVDGDTSDWAEVAYVPLAPECLVADCAGVVADGLQVVRSNDSLGRAALAFHVRLAGGAAPPTSSDVDYVIELRDTPEYPAPVRDQLLVSATREPRYLRNGFEIKPPLGLATPYTVQLTPDGVEGTFSLAILPFPFGARLAVYAVQLDPVTHLLRDVVASTPLARACWAEDAPVAHDPCELDR